MTHRLALLWPALLLAAAPAGAADRRFTISSFDRIRSDAPIRIVVRTRQPTGAIARASPAQLDQLRLRVEGRTLVVSMERRALGGGGADARGPVDLALTTHELNAVTLIGSGSLGIDAVRGQRLSIAMLGAGRVEVAAIEVDQLDARSSGAGLMRLGGRAARMVLVSDGSGSVNAAALRADNAELTLSGSGMVEADVRGTAKISATGNVTARIDGGPSCLLRLSGNADVIGCRERSDQQQRR